MVLVPIDDVMADFASKKEEEKKKQRGGSVTLVN
jgi:hypothetical protein